MYLMKFPLSPLVLLAALFMPCFAAPTESALSGRAAAEVSIDAIVVIKRGTEEATKRSQNVGASSIVVIKRGTEEADE